MEDEEEDMAIGDSRLMQMTRELEKSGAVDKLSNSLEEVSFLMRVFTLRVTVIKLNISRKTMKD